MPFTHGIILKNNKGDILMKTLFQYDPYFFNYNGGSIDNILESFFYFMDKDNIRPDIVFLETHRFLPQECECNNFDIYTNFRKNNIDMMETVLREFKKHGIKVYWHYRICEVDRAGRSDYKNGAPNNVKIAHPDWVLDTWYEGGMWNLANRELRKFKLDYIKGILSKYDFDGMCVDFLRHLPCLPQGKQWEYRDCVTDFLGEIRKMLPTDKKLGAKVSETLSACRVDGFDIEKWVSEDIIDFIVPGSRSISSDVDNIKKICGDKVSVYPCWDTWHASDACHWRDDDFYRGVFASWAAKGADGIMGFNYMTAPEAEIRRLLPDFEEFRPSIYYGNFVRQLKDSFDDTLPRIYVAERRGGYPYMEGAGCNNTFAPLPMNINKEEKASVPIYVAKENEGELRLVLSGDDIAVKNARVELWFNSEKLEIKSVDRRYIDRQIFYPQPQRASGAGYCYTDAPSELLMICANIGKELVRKGENIVETESDMPLNIERTEIRIL